MKKLLTPKDILLLSLGALGDAFEEIRDPFGLMAKGYEEIYGFVPRRLKRHNYNHLVWRNLKSGHIEKIIKNGVPYLRLTSKGEKAYKRDFSFFALQKTKWDKKWRVVLFDIEELQRNTRDRLREKLKELGFGQFQQSVYISPHDFARDLKEFIESRNLSDYVFVLEVSSLLMGNTKILAQKIWKLDELQEKYQEVIDKIQDLRYLISPHGRVEKLNTLSNKNKDELKKKIRKIQEVYLEILHMDPLLPTELLPSYWNGSAARMLIRRASYVIDNI